MWLLPRRNRITPDCATSAVLERPRQIERDHAELLSRMEADRRLPVFTAQIIGVAQAAPVIGGAFEKFAQTMRTPSPRGRAGRARARVAERDERGRFLARASRSVLVITCAIVLTSFRAAFAKELPCEHLETADADELLAMVDPQSIQYGGGVRVGEYDCVGQKVCDWKTTLEDDRMLDHDHRLIYVLSSHQTGSGSWQDLLVFGCASGRVNKIFLGQFGPDTPKEEVFDSAPPALRSALMEYVNQLRTISPIDCDKVMTELQMGKSVAELVKDMNVLMGSVERCRKATVRPP